VRIAPALDIRNGLFDRSAIAPLSRSSSAITAPSTAPRIGIPILF